MLYPPSQHERPACSGSDLLPVLSFLSIVCATMRSSIFFLILSSVSQPLSCTAAPTPTRAGRDEVAKRRLLGAAGGAVGGLLGVVGTALSDLNNLGSTATGAEGYSSALNLLQSVTPTATPTALEPQTAVLSSIFQAPK